MTFVGGEGGNVRREIRAELDAQRADVRCRAAVDVSQGVGDDHVARPVVNTAFERINNSINIDTADANGRQGMIRTLGSYPTACSCRCAVGCGTGSVGRGRFALELPLERACD